MNDNFTITSRSVRGGSKEASPDRLQEFLLGGVQMTLIEFNSDVFVMKKPTHWFLFGEAKSKNETKKNQG